MIITLGILKYLKRYKLECTISPIFKFLEAVMELLVPLLVANIIDNGIKHNNQTSVIVNALIMVLFAILGYGFAIVAQYFAAKAAVGLAAILRQKMFEHINKFSFKNLDEQGVSTLITRLTSDTNQVQSGVNLTLRLALRSPLIVFGAMIMAFSINAKIALIFLGVIAVLFVVVFATMSVTLPINKKIQSKLDNVLTLTRENLSGVRVIRAFCKEDNELEGFKTANKSLFISQNKSGIISALLNPFTIVVINFAIIGIISMGADMTYNGILTQGAVVALYNYMAQILVELLKLANLIISITKAIASGRRIEEVLKTTPSEEKQLGEDLININSIEFKGVSFSYQNTLENSLSNVSFTAKKGEIIGIVGSTGAGKTTLINLIPSFYTANKGEILINGQNIEKFSKQSIRSKISYVSQKPVLFKGSIKDNLLWGNQNATEKQLLEAVKTAQAENIISERSEGLNAIVEQGGKNLSGGQKQRLTIARALIKNSEVIILDDSFSALDNATEKALREAIKKLDNKPIIFIVSQRTSSVCVSDKIIVLDDGKMVGYGTQNELLNSCEVYKEIYSAQFWGKINGK